MKKTRKIMKKAENGENARGEKMGKNRDKNLEN